MMVICTCGICWYQYDISSGQLRERGFFGNAGTNLLATIGGDYCRGIVLFPDHLNWHHLFYADKG